MAITLERGNVVKTVDSQKKADGLIAQGFKVTKEEKPKSGAKDKADGKTEDNKT
jgi:hypothetical protein